MSSDSDCWMSVILGRVSTGGWIILPDLDLVKASAWRSTEYFDDEMDKFDGVSLNGTCIVEMLLGACDNWAL